MSARKVIVTGAFGQVGRVVAEHFEAKGDEVVWIDYAPAPDNASALRIGGVDLSDAKACTVAFERAIELLGAPSVLVNVAGGFTWETLSDGDPETWDRMHRMNTMTTVNACKAALPILAEQKGAAIINIGAVAAGKADAGMGPYAASKAAVARLTESLAAELADKDVTVNAVLPTIVDTATNRADMPDADRSAWVLAEDMARVIAFLASQEARCITGASIPISRGSQR